MLTQTFFLKGRNDLQLGQNRCESDLAAEFFKGSASWFFSTLLIPILDNLLLYIC